jgi:hypothetical protein
MKTRLSLAAVLVACTLCGCATYRYTFDTTISADGTVERTITFVREESEAKQVTKDSQKAEKAGAHEAQPAEPAQPVQEKTPLGLPDNFIMPDEKRFDEFEKLDNGIAGKWHSQGVICTDFRMRTKSHTARGERLDDPGKTIREPAKTRDAYNEGLVITRDLVLVKTVHYFEEFHDYYTRDEFEKYTDMMLDILDGLFLDILHEDFGGEYDLTGFDAFVRDTLLPLARSSKLYVAQYWAGKDQKDMAANEQRLVHDLIQAGAIQDPFFHLENDFDSLNKWVMAKLHENVRNKATGELLPADVIDRYFTEKDSEGKTAFARTGERLVAERAEVKDEEAAGFDDYFFGFYGTFASGSDAHIFEHTLRLPGPVLQVVPEPASTETTETGSTVKWSFDSRDFFPDGVVLSCVAAVPIEDAQKRLFGRLVLHDGEQMKRYVSLLEQLSHDDREAALNKLRGSVESQALAPFAAFARANLPENWDPKSPEPRPLGELLLFLQGLSEPATPAQPGAHSTTGD